MPLACSMREEWSESRARSRKVRGMRSPATTREATALPRQLTTTRRLGRKARRGVARAAMSEKARHRGEDEGGKEEETKYALSTRKWAPSCVRRPQAMRQEVPKNQPHLLKAKGTARMEDPKTEEMRIRILLPRVPLRGASAVVDALSP